MSDDSNAVDIGEIHKPRIQKLGRRGLMKTLVGIGFTTSTAVALTTEDIKAASSDEVPIVVGYRREDPQDMSSKRIPHKKYVAKDWYRQVQESREKREQVADTLRSKKGIIGVGLTSVDRSNRPGIQVIVDKNHSEASRQNVPTQVEGVPVEVTESTRGKPFASCDTSVLRGWNKNNSDLYSGYEINVGGNGGAGTSTCVVSDGSVQIS